MKVDEAVFDVLTKAQEYTMTNYNIYWSDAENIDGYIDAFELYDIVQDLVVELGAKEEKIEDLEKNIRENYKPKKIDYYDDYGINERDFH